jgi:hypothetical protein
MVLAPLWISFLALLPGLFGWRWCAGPGDRVCGIATNLLGWVGAGFPHALVFPLMPVVPSVVIAAMFAVADLSLSIAALRLLPNPLSGRGAAVVLASWLLLTVVSVFAAPYLMVAAYRLAQ